MDRFDHSELLARLSGHARDKYTILYSVIKGITLANAAYTLALLWSHNMPLYLWFPFWAAGFFAIITTFLAFSVGMLIINFIPDWRDAVFPFFLAVFEFLLFSVLQPDGHNPPALASWYLVFSLFSLCAAIVVWNISVKVEERDYHEDLESLVSYYRRGMRSDAIAASLNALLWFLVWIAFAFYAPQQILGLHIRATLPHTVGNDSSHVQSRVGSQETCWCRPA